MIKYLKIVPGILVLACLGSCVYFSYQFNHGKQAGRAATVTNTPLARGREIPGSARNINYWVANGLSGYRYYDCELSVSEFEAFAEKRRWKLEPVVDVITVRNPFDQSSPARITSGQWFRHTQNNNGGVLAVFDAEEGRFYYSASAR
jgi:hypothetical protein